jgi:hypothetical protein
VAPNAVNGELTCDLSTCDPTVVVAEDGKNGVSVACSVHANGDGSFGVSVNVDAPGAFSFNAQGQVTASGGPGFSIGVNNHVKNTAGTDSTCTVTPRTTPVPGQIIAAYDCPAFDDPSLGQTPGCHAFGYFLFDRCDK